jgi:hypothetical protein
VVAPRFGASLFLRQTWDIANLNSNKITRSQA